MYNCHDLFLNKFGLFAPTQHGFKSTTSVLFEHVKITFNHFDSKSRPQEFIFLSKALDTIDHRIILMKIKSYGIFSPTLKLLTSYLSSPRQYVEPNGTRDHIVNINVKLKIISTGEIQNPQGGTLSPLLFLYMLMTF